MKKILRLCSVMLTATITLVACTKEKQYASEPSLQGETNIKTALAGGPWYWKHQAVVHSPDNVDHGGSDACKDDDTWIFDLSGSAIVNWGATDCGNFPVQGGSYGSWQLMANGALLKLTYNRDMPGGFQSGQEVLWTVEYINNQKLVLKRTVQEFRKSYMVYDTYVKR